MWRVYVAFGANTQWGKYSLEQTVRQASDALDALGSDQHRSRLYQSPAWPDPTLPPYVNAVSGLTTTLSPFDLLKGLQAIEAAFGRVRSVDPDQRYAPRTLDLDLIDYDGRILTTDQLTLPHPRCSERDFVLLPLREVAAQWVHPASGTSIAQLLDRLEPHSTHLLTKDMDSL